MLHCILREEKCMIIAITFADVLYTKVNFVESAEMAKV